MREVLGDFSQDEFRNQGISIDEITENSILRHKASEQLSNVALMQLTVRKHATVYSLDHNHRKEVGLLGDIYKFKNPMQFANTGFVYSTSERVC